MAYDITKSKNSLAGRLEVFIGQMNGLQLNEIKNEFERIVRDPETSASPETRNKWLTVIGRSKSKVAMMNAITNLYLKAAQLGLSQ